MNMPTLIAATLFTAVSLTAGPAHAAPQIGKPAPAFAVKDSNGQLQTLGDYLGKTVVLEWTNDQCPFVKKHYQGNMQALQRGYTGKGVVWLTVISSASGKQGHLSGERANELTKSREAVPSAVLLDESGSMGRAYDARTTPQMYVIDQNGMLAYMGGIDSIASTEVDDIPKATPYLAQAADAVLAREEVAEPVTQPYGCSIKY
jgi:peroxiredoxin